MIRFIVTVAVVLGGLAIAGPDVMRYRKMRNMSGESPKRRPHVKTRDEESSGIENLLALFASIPSDVTRYLKMKAM